MNRPIFARLRTLSVSTLALLMLGTPFTASSPADATSLARSCTIPTRVVEVETSGGEYDGTLQLHVSPDGIVWGYYHSDDNARFVPVTGGVTGDDNRIWLDIGLFSEHTIHFTGTLSNGDIDAHSSSAFRDGARYTALELTGSAPRSKG